LYRYGAKGRGMQAVARKANATIPVPSRIEQALRAVPSVSQAQKDWPAPPPLSAVLQDLSPELGYAERDRMIKKISLAAQLHQADHATVSYLAHFSETLTESLGEDAKPVLPIFQELLAAKELRSRYLERRRSLLEQKQAAESATLHLKVAIAALEDSPAPLKEQSQEQPSRKTPERLWRSLGLADSAPPSVPPSYGGPTVVGGLPGMQQRMKMRYESQVPGARRRHPARPRHRAALTTHTLHPPTSHHTHTHTLSPPPPPSCALLAGLRGTGGGFPRARAAPGDRSRWSEPRGGGRSGGQGGGAAQGAGGRAGEVQPLLAAAHVRPARRGREPRGARLRRPSRSPPHPPGLQGCYKAATLCHQRARSASVGNGRESQVCIYLRHTAARATLAANSRISWVIRISGFVCHGRDACARSTACCLGCLE
jgi:hypothetical protein